jgi:GDSL-like Lipase/Acylhydrolase
MQKLFLVILFFALTSCGGGGGSSTSTGITTSSYSGVAIDGNLYLATAFLDLNGNGTYDSGEPTATTDSSGAFTLTATADQISSHSVVVSAIAGTTIDQDTPNVTMTSSMTMMAPAGSPSVISPLTTQVSAKMAAGMSLSAAKTAVQTELGLTSIDVTKNYVLEKATNSAYSDAHKVAASVAEVLKNIDTQSSASTTLASKLSALTTQVTSSVAPIVTQIKSAASLDGARTAVNTQISSAVNIYSIGGSISGLSASGLILANGTNTVSPSSGDTSFTFSTQKATSATYGVTVQANPTGQTCTISNASGIVASQSISNIAVTCTSNPRTLSGTITGLTTSGLVINNGSDELTVSSGASTFQLGSTVASGATYSVTIKTQPTGKTCSVANGSGTMTSAAVSNVQVTCATNSYTLGGSISGLVTSGLKLKNGSETLTISSGSSSLIFNTQVSYGGGYSVTIDTQPTGYTCSLSNSSGTMGAANITSVQVTCAINSYSLSGSISGLDVSGLKIKNGSETLTIPSGATSFVFSNSIAFGGNYAISVDTQPSGLNCSIAGASGTLVTQNISSPTVVCKFSPSRVIAFGDDLSTVDANGYGTYTVNTSETNTTVASRLASKYGLVLRAIPSASSVVPAGESYSYATGFGDSASTATQINNFLSSNTPQSSDLFVITIGREDIMAATATFNTQSIDIATTTLTNAVKSLTNSGAKHVLVVNPINVARTPLVLTGFYSSYASNAQALSYDTGTSCLSFTCLLTTKLNSAFPASASYQPVLLADLMSYFNLITGTVNTASVNTFLSYGVANPDVYVCINIVPFSCSISSVTTGTSSFNGSSWDYTNSIFAGPYLLTPFAQRLLADYIYEYIFYRAGWR